MYVGDIKMRLLIDHVSLCSLTIVFLKLLLLSFYLFLVPSITQIKNFFRQPNIYSTIADLNVTNITLEDRYERSILLKFLISNCHSLYRATVERIISTPAELLSERLLWDRNMSRFIRLAHTHTNMLVLTLHTRKH